MPRDFICTTTATEGSSHNNMKLKNFLTRVCILNQNYEAYDFKASMSSDLESMCP